MSKSSAKQPESAQGIVGGMHRRQKNEVVGAAGSGPCHLWAGSNDSIAHNRSYASVNFYESCT